MPDQKQADAFYTIIFPDFATFTATARREGYSAALAEQAHSDLRKTVVETLGLPLEAKKIQLDPDAAVILRETLHDWAGRYAQPERMHRVLFMSGFKGPEQIFRGMAIMQPRNPSAPVPAPGF